MDMNRNISMIGKKDRRTFLNCFLVISIPLVIVTSLIFLAIYLFEVKNELNNRKHLERNRIKNLKESIVIDFHSVVSDLMILSEVPGLKQFLEKKSLKFLE